MPEDIIGDPLDQGWPVTLAQRHDIKLTLTRKGLHMTLAEFKAWFEGFTETMEGAPTEKQWERIQERVAQIDGSVITRDVIYRDRYWPRINDGVLWGLPYSTCTSGTSGMVSGNLASGGLADAVSDISMPDLGRAEFKAIAV